MNNVVENELWPQDVDLLNNMKINAISEEERTFFEIMEHKMSSEYAPCGDIVYKDKIPNGIILWREQYNEFGISSCSEAINKQVEECHVMSLAEVLPINLKSIGLMDRDITLLQWLREQNYQYVIYNGNQM